MYAIRSYYDAVVADGEDGAAGLLPNGEEHLVLRLARVVGAGVHGVLKEVHQGRGEGGLVDLGLAQSLPRTLGDV